MATKQFAIPLDENSIQTGDISFKKLQEAGISATFQLTNVVSGPTNEINLITRKGGVSTSHKFQASVSNGVASAILTASNLASVYSDAAGGDWDYVEAYWTVGVVDSPVSSACNIIQGGRTFNYYGWPPKKK